MTMAKTFPNVGESNLCPVCGKALKKTVTFPDGSLRNVKCLCDCEAAKQQKTQEYYDEMHKRYEREKIKTAAFSLAAETRLSNSTFQNDQQNCPEILKIAKRYTDSFSKMKAAGKGLIFYGPTGTGKTYAAACIANELILQGARVLMTNIMRLEAKYSQNYEKRGEFIDNLDNNDLLILDDLDTKRQNDYMQEFIYTIIDGRYRCKKPLIITTNINVKGIAKQSCRDENSGRIYDRLAEICYPIEVKGSSIRGEIGEKEESEIRGILYPHN